MPTKKGAAQPTRSARANARAAPTGTTGSSSSPAVARASAKARQHSAGHPPSHPTGTDAGDPQGGNHGTADSGAGDPLSVGFLIGLLAGEGHFGGDGRQPHVTLRMHVRHEATFRWLERVFPGGRLYGPYTHGGRSYFQWMARGPYLREHLAPLVHQHRHLLDDYVAARFDTMCHRYTIDLGAVRIPETTQTGRPS